MLRFDNRTGNSSTVLDPRLEKLKRKEARGGTSGSGTVNQKVKDTTPSRNVHLCKSVQVDQ